MSKSNDYNLYTLVEDYDMSRGDKNFVLEMPANLAFSLQAVWGNAAGTLDGQVQIQHANKIDSVSWDDHQTLVGDIDSADNSFTLSSVVPFTSRFFNAKFIQNNLTGGTLSLYLKVRGNIHGR